MTAAVLHACTYLSIRRHVSRHFWYDVRKERARRNAAITCLSKSQEYNEVMKSAMRWEPDAPFDYPFERGLSYHHILDNELLCGSQPTSAEDILSLKRVEDVDTIISVRAHYLEETLSLHCHHHPSTPASPKLKRQH
jgi:hypothetical protein